MADCYDNVMQLRECGSWKSDRVALGYVRESDRSKREHTYTLLRDIEK